MAGFRTIALGAALIAATAGAVSAQSTQGTAKADTAKAGEWRKAQPGQRRGQIRSGNRHGMKHGMRARGGHRGHGMAREAGRGHGTGIRGMEFMRDLNLTETQRTQVRAIHEKYQPQVWTIHERAETEFAATRDARQRGDTAAVRAALQRTRQSTEAQLSTVHEQMSREVRAILTAEQRAKIDTRIAERIKRLDEQKARLERLRR